MIVKTFESWSQEINQISKKIIFDWKDKVEYILLPLMDNLDCKKFHYLDGNFESLIYFKKEDIDFINEELIKVFNYFKKLNLHVWVEYRIIKDNRLILLQWEADSLKLLNIIYSKLNNHIYKDMIDDESNHLEVGIYISDGNESTYINFNPS